MVWQVPFGREFNFAKFSHKSQFAFSLSAHCREAEEDINIYEEFSARMYQCNNIAWVRVLSIPLLPKWSKSNKYNKLPISPQDYYQTCVHSAFTSVSLFSFPVMVVFQPRGRKGFSTPDGWRLKRNPRVLWGPRPLWTWDP